MYGVPVDINEGDSHKCYDPDVHESHSEKDVKVYTPPRLPASGPIVGKDEEPNQPEDNPEVLRNMLIEACKKNWQHIKRISLFVMNDFGGYQVFDRVAQWCLQHPQMAICIIAAGLVAFLPIFFFFAFALLTIALILTGLLALEGTLLTILTMTMCGLFGALAVVVLFFVHVGLATTNTNQTSQYEYLDN